MPQRSAPPAEPRLLLAVAAVILTETIAALLWAGAAAERLSQLEIRQGTLDEMTERTIRLEEQTAGVRAAVLRIERKIDQQRGAAE